MDLRMKATAICETHYKAKCGACPLRPVCCVNIGRFGGIKMWEAALDDLVEKIIKRGDDV